MKQFETLNAIKYGDDVVGNEILKKYDYVIVGGGSAGCVMANRLSADPSVSVLLCEAGMDTPEDAVPAEISDSYPGKAFLREDFVWSSLKATSRSRPHNQPTAKIPENKYEQAKVLGGGSSINGQFFNRGAPSDYDEWEELGAEGWNWNSVLPYFRKVENDLDFDGPLHGKDGSIPVRRIFPEHWPEHAKAMAKALEQEGYEYVEDQNGVFRDGYMPITISNRDERRVSSAIGYLGSDVRKRPNLTILTKTQVDRLVFEGKRCVGVEVSTTAGHHRIEANEVILSSGAIHSPAMLLRSGVGPREELEALNIQVVHDLPGVGKNLTEHPSIAIAGYLKASARPKGPSRRHIFLGWRYSSNMDAAPPGDMFMALVSKSSWHAVGQRIGTQLLYVNKPFSHHGEVTITSPDANVPPKVAFNLLADRRDLERLVDGFKRIAKLLKSSAMREVLTDPFAAAYGERVRKAGKLGQKNQILTNIFSFFLDGPAKLRTFLMENIVSEAASLDVLINDEDKIEEFVRNNCVGIWHPSCSCRMGSEDDPMAVTDSHGRVHGMAGLRVVDASVFPRIPIGNTNFPVMMTAERMADLAIEERASLHKQMSA